MRGDRRDSKPMPQNWQAMNKDKEMDLAILYPKTNVRLMELGLQGRSNAPFFRDDQWKWQTPVKSGNATAVSRGKERPHGTGHG